MTPEDKVKVTAALKNICEIYAPHDGSESVVAYMSEPDHEVLRRWQAVREALAIMEKPEPTATRPKNSQEWIGMDGATAFLLIERHADGWPDIELMMHEWRDAAISKAMKEPS